MAAALSYRTIFGLVPALVVGLVVLRAFATPEDIGAILEKGLAYAGISQIVIDDEPEQVIPDPDEAPEQGPKVTEGEEEPALPEAGPSSQERLDEWIRQRVQAIGALNLKTVGIIGIVLLVYSAISMLVEVERAFNQIYRAQAGRSWTRRIVQYWAVLTLGSIVIVASFALGEWFRSVVAGMAEARGLTNLQVLFTIIGFLTTVVISMMLLVFLYRTMPNTHVHFRTAMVGAVVAAVLWEAGKWGFTRYLDYSSGLQRLYGQMAILPLFLLWIYLTWLIVLFGLQVSYGMQMYSTWHEEQDDDDRPSIVDPLAIVAIVSAVTRAFAKGKSLRADQVAMDAGLREDIARRMLEALAAGGVVHQVRDADEPAFALAKPAEEIQAEDLFAIGRRMVTEPSHECTRAFYDDLQARTRQLVAGKTIAGILATKDESQEPTDDSQSSQDRTNGGPAAGAR